MIVFFANLDFNNPLSFLMPLGMFALMMLSQLLSMGGSWDVFNVNWSPYGVPIVASRGVPEPAAESSSWLQWLCSGRWLGRLLGLALVVLALRNLQQQVRAHGWQGTMRRTYMRFDRRAQPRARGTVQQRRDSSATERRASVEKAIQRLPIRPFLMPHELSTMTTSQLVTAAREAGVDVAGCVEKSELVARLAAGGGTSAASCSICCEDYSSGELLRVLPCRHCFHVECVDKWLFTSTNYSRPPACPMCNDPLPLA